MERKFPEGTHWRDSARPVKLFFMDANAAFPVLLWLVHIRWWTFYIMLVAVAFFSILSRFGFTPIVFKRWLRSFMAGPRKIAKPWWA